jgi:integrase
MNTVYTQELFDEKTKSRFLKNQTTAMKKRYSLLFKKSALMEKKYNIDLYDFSLEQVRRLLLVIASTQVSTLHSYGNLIEIYITWAIEQDLRKDNINPVVATASKAWYKTLLYKGTKTLFSDAEVMELIKKTKNYQDKAAILALYEGLYGNGYTEILNLKISDLDKTSMTVVLLEETKEGNKQRVASISPMLYNLLIEANLEDEYLKNNGSVAPGTKTPVSRLLRTDFIIRTVENSKTNATSRSESTLISRRLGKLADIFGTPGMTPTNLRNSGMLKMAYDLYKDKGTLDKEDYYLIGERYNFSKNKDGLFLYSRLKTDFLNVERIREVYDDLL